MNKSIIVNRTIVVMLFTLLSQVTLAEELAEYKEYAGSSGEINWTKGRVSAEGFGVVPAGKNKKVAPLLACRAAIVDAQRNLLESIQGVRVNSTTLVSNFVATSDEIKTQVEGVIQGAVMTSREPSSDGSCKVTMEINLAGQISQTIYANEQLITRQIEFKSILADFWANISFFPKAFAGSTELSSNWQLEIKKLNDRLTFLEKKLSESTPVNPATVAARTEQLPTGLVVDARGSNFIPSLSPKLRKLRGAVIYPSVSSKTAIMDTGRLVSLFAREVDFAINHPIVGEKPLLVKALRTWGKTRAEIVLSEDTAEKLELLSKNNFFNDAGVIIVLD